MTLLASLRNNEHNTEENRSWNKRRKKERKTAHECKGRCLQFIYHWVFITRTVLCSLADNHLLSKDEAKMRGCSIRAQNQNLAGKIPTKLTNPGPQNTVEMKEAKSQKMRAPVTTTPLFPAPSVSLALSVHRQRPSFARMGTGEDKKLPFYMLLLPLWFPPLTLIKVVVIHSAFAFAVKLLVRAFSCEVNGYRGKNGVFLWMTF